ncbi:hypothetical protein TUM20983_43100 [Mycobacterium antarcticum]|nr:hypothetical protein TUM20983_43100 [Mycolicibacterium sp. TUM20983]
MKSFPATDSGQYVEGMNSHSFTEMRRPGGSAAVAVITAAMIAATFGLAGPATALPTGGDNAVEAIEELRDAGYDVQVNGWARTSWTGCRTTAVHAPPLADEPPGDWATAHVTVWCPDETP